MNSLRRRLDQHPLGVLLGLLTLIYLLSGAALILTGRSTAVPWDFFPYLTLVALPLAVVTVAGLAFVPRLTGMMRIGWPLRALCLPVGIGLTYWSTDFGVWTIPAALALASTTIRQWNREKAGTAVLAAATVAVGYACVWNGNYLLAAVVDTRLFDASFIAFDSRVLGKEYTHLFPLCTNPVCFKLLENSYLMLFPQVIAVMLLSSTLRSQHTTARLLAVLFGAYAIGLAIFAVIPAVGPPIYAPASFMNQFSQTTTAQLMTAMATEYQQLQRAGRLSGFGYFVAFPSLHVAAAVILQSCMREEPLLFWAWIPVTCLLILSTVVLGYHYLLDVPAGLCLGFALCRFMPGIESASRVDPDDLAGQAPASICTGPSRGSLGFSARD
jgi:membrane-associated phospholipid phosphatase